MRDSDLHVGSFRGGDPIPEDEKVFVSEDAGTVYVRVKPLFDLNGFDLLHELRMAVREELQAALKRGEYQDVSSDRKGK